MIVRIIAKRDGFRRCGIAHPAQPVEYPVERFSSAELVRLKAEPMLEVVVLDAEPSVEAAADAKPAAKPARKAQG